MAVNTTPIYERGVPRQLVNEIMRDLDERYCITEQVVHAMLWGVPYGPHPYMAERWIAKGWRIARECGMTR